MKTIKLLFIGIVTFLIGVTGVNAEELTEVDNASVAPSVMYKTHVQTDGWNNFSKDGEMSGTEGQAKRLEAIVLKLNSEVDGGISYQTHIQTYGWESSWKKNGEMSGTEGKAKRLEAIKIKLTGNIASQYDVYYRVHVQTYGWLDWAKNGEMSGTEGQAKRLEAIEVKLVKKTSDSTPYVREEPSLSYTSHVQSYGWRDYVNNGAMTGTTGEGKRIEALKAIINSPDYTGNIKYMSYIQGNGWESSWKSNNEVSGTIGEAKRIEAIKFILTEELDENYDIYYRAHVQGYGWLGWAKNGEIAGSLDCDLRIEAFEIKLVKKGTGEETGDSYKLKETKLKYQAHVRKIGDQEVVSEGEIAGTTGMDLRMEAIKISADTTLSGSILYQTYVESKGWEDKWTTSNNYSGTTGESKAIQLIKIKLDGELAEKYDIYYRVHSEKYGWLGWAKNGEAAGATFYDIQAIQIKLILKVNSNRVDYDTTNHYVETGFYTVNGNVYYKDKNGKQATDWIEIMGRKYFFNSLGVMIAEGAKKVVDVSSWNGSINWSDAKNKGGVDAVIIRGAYRGYETGNLVTDNNFVSNVKGAAAQGLPVGIYIYSQAINKAEAEQEAQRAIDLANANGGKLVFNMPIVFDSEYATTSHVGRADKLSKAARTEIALAFLNKVKAAGYEPMLYASTNFLKENLDMSKLSSYKLWVAQYYHYCTYDGSGNKTMWQYSSTESVSGFNGNVDVSVWF